MTRIGIFGGTFDPPHLAHLLLAETCIDALHLTRVLWVPAATPPHKNDKMISTAAHRVKMVEAAIKDNPRFDLSLIDVDRPGPHYSADMAGLVADEHPGAALFFLMGGDSLHDLPQWHEPARLLAQCALGVIRRPDDELDKVLPQLYERLPSLDGKLHVVDAPRIEISGTRIRQRVRDGLSLRYRVPDTVIDYIQQAGLYSAQSE